MSVAIYPVHMDGTLYYSDGYPDAKLTDHTKVLNGMGTCKFKMPDVATHNFDGVGTEIQIWIDGVFFDWLVCVRAQSDGRVVEVECKDLTWYFHRRVTGKANRTNHLTNPSFEVDSVGSHIITGWTAVNCTPTIINSNYELGGKAVQLVQGADDADAYLAQNVTETTGPEGLDGILAVWFYIDSMSGPALEQRGIYTDTTLSVNPAWYPLTMSQPIGVWTRQLSAKEMGPGVTDTFQLRLYCPKGTITYDACQFVYQESISTTFPIGYDQHTIIDMLRVYAQDVAQGKSDLNIGISGAATGVVRAIAYQFVDHENILEKMLDYTKFHDGLDLGMTFVIPSLGSSSCQRLLTTWAIVPGSSAGRGSVRTSLAASKTTALQAGEIVEMQFLQDLEATSTSVIEMSDTSDPAREEGGAVDASGLGGLILELVEQAPEGVPINTLDSLAAQRLAEVKSIVGMPVITVRSTPTKDYSTLMPGDQLPISYATGGFSNISDTLRVMQIDIPDPKRRHFKLTFNRPII